MTGDVPKEQRSGFENWNYTAQQNPDCELTEHFSFLGKQADLPPDFLTGESHFILNLHAFLYLSHWFPEESHFWDLQSKACDICAPVLFLSQPLPLPNE